MMKDLQVSDAYRIDGHLTSTLIFFIQIRLILTLPSILPLSIFPYHWLYALLPHHWLYLMNASVLSLFPYHLLYAL